MTRLSILLIGLLSAPPLAAQATFVGPEPKLDSARATLRDQLLQFRDSLNTIDAAAARLQRDYRQTSDASLISRARIMANACARSARNLPTARKAVLSAEASDKRRVQRDQLIQELDRLQRTLTRCETDFGALSNDGGEKVRGYGNHHAIRVQASLRQYERVLASFFNAMGIKVLPLAAPPGRLAG